MHPEFLDVRFLSKLSFVSRHEVFFIILVISVPESDVSTLGSTSRESGH